MRPLLLITLLAATLLGLLVGLRHPYAHYAARLWYEQLETAPDRQAEPLLRKIAALEGPGIPALVAAVGSRREAVARAARDLIDERLANWQQQGLAKLDEQKRLVQTLLDQMDRYGPTARADAALWASRVLSAMPDASLADRSELIRICEAILQRESEGRTPLAERAPWATVEPNSNHANRADTGEGSRDLAPALAKLPHLPGGGLPLDAAPRAATLEPLFASDYDGRRTAMRGGTKADSANREAEPAEPGYLPRTQEISRPLNSSAHRLPRDYAARPMSMDALTGEGADTIANPLRTPDSASKSADQFNSVDDLSLMRLLRSADASEASAAKSEMLRRGFSEVECELGRLFCDPDPQVRIGLAQSLPSLRSVDAKGWLLRLCRDEDAEVRLAAITLAATAADPSLVQAAEQLARLDSDPRIQRCASRMSVLQRR
ncbi:MAG: HEAT repeat domain-containing protein [Planctomycetota bacterium]